MKEFESKVISIDEAADRTILATLEKTSGFDFRAGQSMDVTIPNLVGDDHGNSRVFSIASAPHEAHLMVATRNTESVFKKRLAELSAGEMLTLDGPHGSFVLHQKSERPAVFIAGGIGITPFRSMAVDALERNLGHQIFLFYSNRRPKDAAFFDELQGLAGEHASFTFVPTMTDAVSEDNWMGETALVSGEMIDRYVDRAHRPVYYIAGPPGMVVAVRDGLIESGLDEDDIRYEEFAGY